MRLKHLELNGFKSFAKKSSLDFESHITAIVGPNGSGKSNIVEAFRFALGEQSIKSMRGKSGSDLVFSGSKNLPKGNRALVSLTFDNEDRIFKLLNNEGENINLNYENIIIQREVYLDGINKYILNNSEVRLKDIHALLSSVNIGSSTHHIISQGEADRILNSSPKDRKEMIEEALGLKIFQYQIKDSERKLEKATLNIKEVGMLRRENAPHLNFLKKQIEKFEKTKELKVELLNLYFEYLKKEDLYIKEEKRILREEKNKTEANLIEIREKIRLVEEGRENNKNEKFDQLRDLENKISELRRLKNELERKLGRLEGILESLKIRQEFAPEKNYASYEEFKKVYEDIKSFINQALDLSNLEEVKIVLKNIVIALSSLEKNIENKNEDNKVNKIFDLENEQKQILEQMTLLDKENQDLLLEQEKLKEEINQDTEKQREGERERFALKVKEQEISSVFNMIMIREDNLNKLEEAFVNEINEGKVLVGSSVLDYENYVLGEGQNIFDRSYQDELKRKIERLKIKLEDSGLINEHDILKEYKEAKERDEFLAKEIEDLTLSIESLNKLIDDLKKKIEDDFKIGIEKINLEFKKFFMLMFGGGDGKLTIIVENKKRRGEDDEDEIVFEQGIEINVSLPSKKVKELQALSGGERSLTSIALLFAMSQVNPPPFLILDETDAALDEANSRKYGDMLERLSQKSQLIVVTHNRETMSRASVLYGVTIGADGSSKLLSIKFEEAQAIAK